VMTVFILTRCRRPARAPLQPLVTSRAVWRTNGRKPVVQFVSLRGHLFVALPIWFGRLQLKVGASGQCGTRRLRRAVPCAVQCSAVHCTAHGTAAQYSTVHQLMQSVYCAVLCAC